MSRKVPKQTVNWIKSNPWLYDAGREFKRIYQRIAEIGTDEIDSLSQLRKIQLYILSSYMYYELDDCMMDDHMYDYLCKILHDDFENLEYTVRWLDKENLRAGSGFTITDKNCPSVIRLIAHELVGFQIAPGSVPRKEKNIHTENKQEQEATLEAFF